MAEIFTKGGSLLSRKEESLPRGDLGGSFVKKSIQRFRRLKSKKMPRDRGQKPSYKRLRKNKKENIYLGKKKKSARTFLLNQDEENILFSRGEAPRREDVSRTTTDGCVRGSSPSVDKGEKERGSEPFRERGEAHTQGRRPPIFPEKFYPQAKGAAC